MNPRKALLCLTVLHLAIPALASPGFLSIDNAAVPVPVRNASSSVFKISSQGGLIETVVNMRDSEAVVAKIDQLNSQGNWWQKLQIDQCKRDSVDTCPLFAQMGDGSTFILNDQFTLYTNLHNFFETLTVQVKTARTSDALSIRKLLDGFPMFFGVSDANHKPIFDPTTERARLTLFNSDPALYDGTKNSMTNPLGRLSDMVELKSENKIDRTPLRMAKEKPKVGDTAYIVGFPMQTNNRSTMGAADSDGKSLYVTAGKIISVQTWKEKSQMQVSPLVEKLFEEHMLFGDFDCEHGNSGGPILNSEGEVVAIMAGMWLDKTQFPYTRICGGLKTFDKQKLKELWNALGAISQL